MQLPYPIDLGNRLAIFGCLFAMSVYEYWGKVGLAMLATRAQGNDMITLPGHPWPNYNPREITSAIVSGEDT